MANKKQKQIIKTTDGDLIPAFMVALKRQKKVKITGMGIFYIIGVKSRTITLPGTGKKMKIGSYNRVHFKPTQTIKDYLNQ